MHTMAEDRTRHSPAGQAPKPVWHRKSDPAGEGVTHVADRTCACGGACPRCRSKAAQRLLGGATTSDHGPQARTSSAPEDPTHGPGGVTTETIPWDSGGPSALMPAQATDNHCAVTGSFSSIPSGVLAATMNGSKLGTTFNMVGDFNSAIPCTCACGEYRQYVRGTFTANGAPVTHQLGPGLTLHPTNYQLDGNATTANYFGRRDYRTSYSHFEPDQAGGCQFQGSDIPGISAGSGTALTVNLDFIGKLIDTCASNHELASSSWSVVGSGTVA